MRIFVYEHVTGGAMPGEPLSPSLAREGRAMLEAISADISRLPGVSVATTAETRRSFDTLARECEGTLLIAPELDGELVRLARRVLEVGGRLLGPSPDAIEAVSDKLLLPRRLRERGIPCVSSTLRSEVDAGAMEFPAVVKPRFGAGSIGVRLVNEAAELGRVPQDSIITPFTRGLAASVLVIAGPRGILPLRAGEQILSTDGSFTYLGGRIPLSSRLETRAQRLAVRAVNAVPGLIGFIGVDLILDPEQRERPDDRVVEVNPRLTTSYVGLRALAETNLAEHWLRAIHGEIPAPPCWRSGGVRFQPNGAITLEEGTR